jgi:hypothetical protein
MNFCLSRTHNFGSKNLSPNPERCREEDSAGGSALDVIKNGGREKPLKGFNFLSRSNTPINGGVNEKRQARRMKVEKHESRIQQERAAAVAPERRFGALRRRKATENQFRSADPA